MRERITIPSTNGAGAQPLRDVGITAPAAPTEGEPSDPPLTSAALVEAGVGTEVAGLALVLCSEVSIDRAGAPYLRLALRGADGSRLEARWWRYPYPPDRRPQVGSACWFSGRLESYQGAPQLRVRTARPAPESARMLFARRTRRGLEDMLQELEARLAALEPELQAVTRAVLAGETAERFLTWPAAQSKHGAVCHGLLAHSLRVVTLAEALAAAYGPAQLAHDPHLLVAGALLHDIGKVRTLPAVAGAPLPSDAQQIDHITAGVLLIQTAAQRVPGAAGRLDSLLHILLAHHGRREWGAPVEPQTVEAWLVHLADLAEARLWAWADQEVPSSSAVSP